MEGIRIGELKDGKIYSDLQRYFKALRNRGILLAVCSKNEYDAAIRPFREHPEMVLREDDFVMFVANWEDKASNIRRIRETLNIGMDSIVFIDDNPFERNAVRSQIADLNVPELPAEPEKYLDFLRKSNLFETVSVSGEDAKRTQQYREEARRTESAATFASYDEYLQSLEMVAEAKPFDEFHFARIAQLTQRSKQFNLRTVRYTESDIRCISEDNRFITLYFTLRDKFGDHGLISVVILEKRDNGTLFVNEFLMSCRVLKRGMEEFIINKIVGTAKENGFTLVEGEYIPTQKNAMVAKLYTQHGFTDCGDVEVLDIEPMIEKELASPFHFYFLLTKDLHPTNIGAYYLSQYIYDHLNIYDYPKTLEKNNYRNEPVRFKTKTVYYGEEFKEMDDLVLASNEDPISKDSPFLLVGDSFSMANILKYCLATQFKTKINMISATSSYHITARMLQMRTRDISPETKFCFLVDSSFELYHTFLPMVNTNITVFPDETRFPGRKFEKAGKDPQEEPSFEFDLDLSDLSLKSKKYKLFFSVSSTIAQSYSLVINSNNPVVISSHSSGHGVIEYPLSDISMPLHVVLSTKREAGFPTDQILTLSIDKIFLVEE